MVEVVLELAQAVVREPAAVSPAEQLLALSGDYRMLGPDGSFGFGGPAELSIGLRQRADPGTVPVRPAPQRGADGVGDRCGNLAAGLHISHRRDRGADGCQPRLMPDLRLLGLVGPQAEPAQQGPERQPLPDKGHQHDHVGA